MFLPDNIDLGQSEKYVLSIRLAQDSFMFSIVEPGNEKTYCLRETTFSPNSNLSENIQRIIFDLNFLTQEYKQTNVVIVSDRYDLIPASYFDIKQKKTLYNFTRSDKSGHLLSGLIEQQDMITLYDLDKDIFEFFSRNLWTPRFFHHSQSMIDWYGKKGKLTGTTAKMYIYTHDKLMDVFCFRGQKLIHGLTYKNETGPNQLYYILKLWEKCGFDQLKDHLFFSGDTDELLMSKLNEYIKNIEVINTPSEIYLWSEDAQKAPLDLLTIAL